MKIMQPIRYWIQFPGSPLHFISSITQVKEEISYCSASCFNNLNNFPLPWLLNAFKNICIFILYPLIYSPTKSQINQISGALQLPQKHCAQPNQDCNLNVARVDAAFKVLVVHMYENWNYSPFGNSLRG